MLTKNHHSKYMIIALVLILFSSSLKSFAQENMFIGGVGSTFSLNEKLFGINGRLYYGPNESFCFGPEISFFPYQKIDDKHQVQVMDFGINAHYIFEIFEGFGAYPIAGINYTSEQERLIDDIDDVESIGGFGFKYGAGMHYKISKVYLFAEFTGVIGPLSDKFITAGIIFNIGKNKKEEEHSDLK